MNGGFDHPAQHLDEHSDHLDRKPDQAFYIIITAGVAAVAFVLLTLALGS